MSDTLSPAAGDLAFDDTMDVADGEEAAPAAFLEKLERYQHLLPPLPAEVRSRMDPDWEIAEDDTEVAPLGAGAGWAALDAADAEDRAVGCLLGLAIGDAIGASVAGLARGGFATPTGIGGGGPLGLAPGAGTANTATALCLADSLVALGTVDLDDLAGRLLAHFKGTAGLDIDPGTRPGLLRFIATGAAAAPGGAGEDDDDALDAAGAGSLVRVAPVAILFAHDPEAAQALAVRQSRATHAGIECLDACRLFAVQLGDALAGADKGQALRPRIMALCPRVLFVNGGDALESPADGIRASGDVVDTLEAALWVVSRTDSFAAAVLLAAGLGENASSVAAVAGQLAGALYGAAGIPAEWVEAVAQRGRIEDVAGALFALRAAAGEPGARD